MCFMIGNIVQTTRVHPQPSPPPPPAVQRVQSVEVKTIVFALMIRLQTDDTNNVDFTASLRLLIYVEEGTLLSPSSWRWENIRDFTKIVEQLV